MGELAKTDDVRNMPFSMSLLKLMSTWPTIPTRYQGKPADIHAAVLVGRELGIEPMEAINSLFMVNGQVSMSGKLMSALVHRAGHQLRARLDKEGNATVEAWRREPDGVLIHVGEVSFGPDDAHRAGLDTKDTYKAYPNVMHTWRAISQVCRIYFADVLSGIGYIPEEVNIDDAVIEAIPLDEIPVDTDTADLADENHVAMVAEALDADVVA